MNIAECPLFKRLVVETPFSENEFRTLIGTAPFRYKDHEIEKRNGRGKRLISQPTREVKFLQRLLISKELSTLPIHRCATAYVKGRSTKDHALPHAASRYVLKLDFQNFFPSISARTISHCLARDKDYSNSELWIIERILCRQNKESKELLLSIGAPSSPHISNYIMWEFDKQLEDFCLKNGAHYSRYADDLAISTNHPGILDKAKGEVKRLIRKTPYLDLAINETKTVNISMKRKRSLVGLTLANDGFVSIGRNEKRILRAQLHKVSIGEENSVNLANLKGRLAHLFSIDPEFVKNLCSRHGYRSISSIEFRKKSDLEPPRQS